MEEWRISKKRGRDWTRLDRNLLYSLTSKRLKIMEYNIFHEYECNLLTFYESFVL
jgi:hypothetical protein